MKVLDLFSGIGGMSLGLKWAGMTTVGFVEIEPFCRKILARHWPEVWIHDDIRTLPIESIRERCSSIDIVTAGFPCQDVSCAGKGEGIDGKQSGLWREARRIIEGIRPAWVLIENSPALRTRGADKLLSALEALDYATAQIVVGAWAVGAPHERSRVWIVAHTYREHGRIEQQFQSCEGTWTWHESNRCGQGSDVAHGHGPRESQSEGAIQELGGRAINGGEGVGLADSLRSRLEIGEALGADGQAERSTFERSGTAWPAPRGCDQYDWEPSRLITSGMGRRAYGISGRMARITALGNAVVPAVVEQIGRAIMAIETR